MPINPEVAALINVHLPRELLAHHAYLRMALDANRLGFFGVESFFKMQSEEERGHLVKLQEFINDFDAINAVPAAEAEPVQYTDVASMFSMALQLEQNVTGRIGEIIGAAARVGDWQSFAFLQWFIQEQTQSEIALRDILNRLKIAGVNLLDFDEWIAEQAKG